MAILVREMGGMSASERQGEAVDEPRARYRAVALGPKCSAPSSTMTGLLLARYRSLAASSTGAWRTRQRTSSRTLSATVIGQLAHALRRKSCTPGPDAHGDNRAGRERDRHRRSRTPSPVVIPVVPRYPDRRAANRVATQRRSALCVLRVTNARRCARVPTVALDLEDAVARADKDGARNGVLTVTTRLVNAVADASCFVAPTYYRCGTCNAPQ